jgi:hypothetical protein
MLPVAASVVSTRDFQHAASCEEKVKLHCAHASLQDKVTGHFIPGSWLAAWPFHLALHLRIRLRRARTKEPLYQRVEDGWYISGWPYHARVLPKEQDLAVVDCTCEYPRCHDKPYLCVPTWDTQGVPPLCVAISFHTCIMEC